MVGNWLSHSVNEFPSIRWWKFPALLEGLKVEFDETGIVMNYRGALGSGIEQKPAKPEAKPGGRPQISGYSPG
jgi:hypothetical protein